MALVEKKYGTPPEPGPNPMLRLAGLVKSYGPVEVVKAIDLSVSRGSLVSLLGPSGCGKTTTLRMIAGLEHPSKGEITLDGRRLNAVPIHSRNIGVVFQSYALFPHMTVAQNIGFGLRFSKRKVADRTAEVRRMLDLVRLSNIEDRFPSQLSGGQQQRVALARALIVQPTMLLLDEPLSALDANLREEMRNEITRIQRLTEVTTLFVTHDQSEALSMSDQVVIMNGGNVVQQGTPQQVYSQPRSRFVAEFLGRANLLPAKIVSRAAKSVRVELLNGTTFDVAGETAPSSDRVLVVVRSEHLMVEPSTPSAGSLSAVVTHVEYLGSRVAIHTRVGDLPLVANVPATGSFPDAGETVFLNIGASVCCLIPEE